MDIHLAGYQVTRKENESALMYTSYTTTTQQLITNEKLGKGAEYVCMRGWNGGVGIWVGVVCGWGWAEKGYFRGKGERSLGKKLQTQCAVNPNGWNLVGFNQRREWESGRSNNSESVRLDLVVTAND